ncbi:MAG TPA: hypothetical protein VG742_20675 [Dongiaceae bacterium]|nr:hypothetical protein [Dongiaceae bacterium]
MTSTPDAQAPIAVPPPPKRLALGVALMVLAIAVKIVGPALIVASGLPPSWKTGLSIAIFVIVPKLLIVTIIFLMGKSGFAYLKAVCFKYVVHVIAPFAPPRQVSKRRYRIGLVMFILPMIEAWLAPYLEAAFPGWAAQRPMEWAWDVMFVASFFVLGGDFWDKVRALFIYGATVAFPPKRTA